MAVHTLIYEMKENVMIKALLKNTYDTLTRPTNLILRDLHVEDDVIYELWKSFLHSALELLVLQQCVDKLEDAEDEVLKAKDLTCDNDNELTKLSAY